MQLKEIYQPIKNELKELERILESSLQEAKNESILKVNRYLLESSGKRLRPALVILSAKATSNCGQLDIPSKLNKIAAAIELIHTASLIHDDIIDHSLKRHHKPTINKKFGQDVAIALGDYLYAKAFDLISSCGNLDILSCISYATCLMCEGELLQVCERENLDLLKERYLLIIKKKTAGLFAASCQAGAMVTQSNLSIQKALKVYGLNFGIAFQIIDDCLDLTGQQKDLGKSAGTDFKMGELTLPVLNLLYHSQDTDKNRIIQLLKKPNTKETFQELRQRFINSPASLKTKEDISFYIQKAKESLRSFSYSEYRKSLESLADFIQQRVSFLK